MIKYFVGLIIVLNSALVVFAQEQLTDSTQFDKDISFLKRKLNFTYYSEDQKLWWVNKFNYKPDIGQIQIKHISAKNHGKINGKTYNVNSVLLSDLNPFNITSTQNKKSSGRFAKGSKISLHTVKNQNLVQKEVNGQRLTPRSFIYLSLPSFLDDSLNVSGAIITAFQNVIEKASSLYNQNDSLANFKIIFETLMSNHQYSDSAGVIIRFSKKLTDYVIVFEDYQDRKKLRDVLFGYNPIKNTYYEILIEANGDQTIQYFTVEDSTKLALISKDKQTRIWFANRSKVHYQTKGKNVELSFYSK